MKYTKIQNAARLLVAGTCLVTAGASQGAEFWLRSGTNTLTMPDGRVIPVWGFAQDSANWAVPGTVTVPGPQLNVAAGDTLIIHVTNTLPEPVSVVIPGQYGSTAAGQATPHDNPAYAGRMRSLTVEAASGKTQDFIWSNVQPGTFLYHSGSHPSVQVEMGLHGALAVVAPGPQVYAGVPFNSSATLVFGAIDPDLHDAVGAGTFGPGPGFYAGDFANASALIAALNGSGNSVAIFVASMLSTNNPTGDPGILASDLNAIIGGPSIYDPGLFPDNILSAATLALLKSSPPPTQNSPLSGAPVNGDLVRMNRLLLQDGLAQAALGVAFPAVRAMTSAIRAYPQYFMINGQPYTNGQPPIAVGAVGTTNLVRMLNATADAHVPTFNNMGDLTLVGEDGQPLNYPRSSTAFYMPALKTYDLLLAPTLAGTNAVYDRRLGLVSGVAGGTNMPGGMLTYLAVRAAGSSAPPAVLVPPANAIAFVGQPASFSFVATHGGTLSYQWLLNGSPISGATAATYSIASAALANAGSYSVRVTDTTTGGASSTTSAVGTLTVVTQPAPVTVADGGAANFSVTPTPATSLTYQWRKDGVAISGATGSSYSFTANYATDNGHSYSVVATGPGASATSAGALLTVTTVAAAIVTQPGNQTVPDFATATFSVSATGSGLTYQWQRRTNTTVTATYTNIPGATASSYSLVASFARDNGATFRVIVSGLVGASVTSTTATLTVNPVGPQIITQPFSIIANYGQPTNLTVVAQASGTLAYRWQRGVGATATFTNLVNGGGISGVLSPALAFNVAATANLANNGNYRVIVSSTGAGAGSVTSVVVSLTFQITPPTITAQPVSLTVIGGPTTTSVSFNVAAFGVPTPAYLWQRFDGTNWTSLIGAAGSTGAASPTLTLRPGGLNVTLRDAGSYRVVLSNLGGSVTSSVAGLTVSQTFAGAPITIPLAGGTATPYPATTAAVPPLTGAEIRHASVSMILSSDEPFDANALLVSPGALVSARKVVFMAGLGPRPTEITSLTNPELGLPHQYAVTNCALTFDDSASAPASTNYWLAPGTYQPSIHPWNLPLVPWPAPAPGLPYPMAFNALNALTAADGQWRLYVNDTVGNAGVDLAPPVGVNGSMNPWSLTLTAGPLGGPKPPPLPLAAPQTPVHLSPGNGVAGTLVTTNRPTYTFSMVDGATQYMIVLRNDVTGQYTDYAWLPAAQVDPGHTGTGSYLQPEPLGPGMYVWFVLAGNAAGMSHFDTSGLAFVTPGAGALSPVQGISPNGAVATRTPTYTFTLSSQVQQYQIQYTSVATGVSTVLGPFQTVNVAGGTIPLTGTYSIVQPTPLASGAYTWVVQSELAAGWAWSNPLPLTVP